MLSYFNDDITPLKQQDMSDIDTVLVGYEYNQLSLKYDKEYMRTNTVMSMVNSGHHDSSSYAIVVNTLYDNALGDIGAPILGYESLFSSVGDVLVKIWKIIWNSIKKLISFVKRMIGKILKFISGLFGDEDKKEDELNTIDKLNSQLREDIASSGGGGGISSSSSDGASPIDNKAEEVAKDMHEALDTTKPDAVILDSLHPNKILEDLVKECSLLTYLNGYYNLDVVNNYMSLLETVNNNNTHLHNAQLVNIILPVIGETKPEYMISILTILTETSKLKPEDKLPSVIKDAYYNLLKNLYKHRERGREILEYVDNVTNDNDADSPPHVEEILELIRKENKIDKSNFIIITSITLNRVQYTTLVNNGKIHGELPMDTKDRLALLSSDDAISSDKAIDVGGTGLPVVLDYSKVLDSISVRDLLTSVNTMIKGYQVILECTEVGQHTQSVPQKKDTDFFINRDTVNMVDTHTRVAAQIANVHSNVKYIDTVKKLLYNDDDIQKLDKITKDLNNTVKHLGKTPYDNMYSQITTSLNMMIQYYLSVTTKINKDYLNTMTNYKTTVNDFINIERSLTRTYAEATKSSINT